MRLGLAISWAMLCLMLCLTPAQAEKRVALVIGNSTYLGQSKLANPEADARAIARMLADAGFDAGEVRLDLGVRDFNRALSDFHQKSRDADIAIIYFAGHGVEFNGASWLMPVDARVESDFDIRHEAVPLDSVIDAIRARVRIVILDSCRNDPFRPRMKSRVRAASRGMARVDDADLPPNTLIAYAAKAGTFARDGEAGAHSPFTSALLARLPEPGIDVERALRNIRDDVLAATGNAQEPFKYGSLGRADVVIKPGLSSDAQVWASMRDTASIAMLEEFLRRYPMSVYAPFATARLDEIKRMQTAAAAPPVAPVAPPAADVKPAVGVHPEPARGARPRTAEEERQLKPKDVFKECDVCPEMVVVPAGSFMMGSLEKEIAALNEQLATDYYKNEGPLHKVSFGRPFAVGRFAVTFAEWDACVAAGGCRGHRPDDAGWGRERRPVIAVSWDDARSYLQWLSRKTGKIYRLLSEAEREYVTRAGTTTPFWWGGSISTNQASYYTSGGAGENRERTMPVDSFEANPWGLYQVHGNVWEWVEDCYQDSYRNAPADGSARMIRDCGSRVLRGPHLLRAACRLKHLPGDRNLDIGFRVARTL